MKNLILAIDPGNIESGYVVVQHDGQEITAVIAKGKVPNPKIYEVMQKYNGDANLAIEMVESYGMAVGREVFDTCVWIGRFMEYWEMDPVYNGVPVVQIFRKEEKMYLCGNLTAKDSNIVQALVDRFAPGASNYGKGTIKEPGFFYGFKKDVWAAMAVAVTYFDKHVKKIAL